MTITTTYERISGEPVSIAIWVITQLKEPIGVFVPSSDFVLLGKERPPSLKVENGILSLTRSPDAPHKIGTPAGTLLWVNEKFALRIDSPRVVRADVEYP